MRAVLYTHDMEPITVLEIPGEWQVFLETHGQMYLACMPPMRVTPPDPNEPIRMDFRQVRITVEKFIRRGQIYWMLFTQDEESAMLLKSTFLPGQQKEVRMREEEAFARGFWKAVSF